VIEVAVGHGQPGQEAIGGGLDLHQRRTVNTHLQAVHHLVERIRRRYHHPTSVHVFDQEGT
jgi:hypothetical protein